MISTRLRNLLEQNGIAFDRFAEGKIRIARIFRRPLDELQSYNFV